MKINVKRNELKRPTLDRAIKLLIFANLTLIAILCIVFTIRTANGKHTNLVSQKGRTSTNKKLSSTMPNITVEAKKIIGKNSKVAYLTFDDGPSENTPKILKILNKNHIHASFFVNGHEGKQAKEMYKLILKDGNIIGNHTYSHEYKYVYKSVKKFRDDVNKLSDYVKNVTGVPPLKILRFPGGTNNTISERYGGKHIMGKFVKEAKKMGYDYVDWNVSSEDATAKMISKRAIVKHVLGESRNMQHVIVLMHDANAKKTTPEALQDVIDGLKKKGYTFDTVDHMKIKVRFKEKK